MLSNANNIDALRAKLESGIHACINAQGISSGFKEALNYVLFPGGKRIRPILAMTMCAELGGQADNILPAAVAIEIFHSASLVHDDLPALDNDELRRGKPSCHVKFGEATAILLADFMVPLAIEVATSCTLPDSSRRQIINALSIAYKNLSFGQYLDLDRQANTLSEIYSLKTGALFKAAAQVAAIGAAKDDTVIAHAAEFGLAIGECFQILDDYLDLFGTDEERGRKGSSDTRNNRATAFSTHDEGKSSGFASFLAAENKAQQALTLLEKQAGQADGLGSSRELLSALGDSARASESK